MKKAILIVLIAVAAAAAWFEPTGTIRGRLCGEPFFEGRSAGAWRRSLAVDDPAEREAAFARLRSGGGETAPVLQYLLADQGASAEVRWTAAELLGKLETLARPAAPALQRALHDADPHVRSVAATALAKLELPAAEAVPPLCELLEREADVPVIRALSVFGSDAAPALERLRAVMLDRSLDLEIRWNAARTIGKMREAGAPAVDDLVKMLDDPGDSMREHAAEALGDIGPPSARAVEPLIKTLGDPFVKARRDAVRSLGQIGPAARPAVPEIRKRLEDPEAIVRDAAKTALERLDAKE